MAKFFITGGAGFIGSHTVDLCVTEGHEVTVFDIKPWKDAVNLQEQSDNITYIEGDIRDNKQLKDSVKGHTHILHLAALVSVPESIEHPNHFHGTNVTGTFNVFESARLIGAERVVYASSAALYGDQKELPISETAQLSSLSPYSQNKLMNEMHAQLYADLYKQSSMGLRYFNVYGPRQDPSSPYSGVISIFIDRIRDGKPVVIYGDGSATRDFVSVYDVARANLLALMSSESGVCNIGTGKAQSINSVVSTIESIFGNTVKRKHKSGREGDIKQSCAAIGGAKECLSFESKDTLESGLQKMLGVM